MAVRKITKRWLLNSFGIVVVIMVAMVIGVSIAMHSYYYSSTYQYIQTRAEAVTSHIKSYAADAGTDFSSQLRTLIEDFEYKNQMEMMAVEIGRAHV